MTFTIGTLVLLALLGAPPSDAGTPRAILRLEDAWRVAQHKNDVPAMEALLSTQLTFVGTSGSMRGRDDFIASRSTSALPRALTYEYSDVLVCVYGSVAIVNGRESTTGEGPTFQGRFTHVWAKPAGTWQLVAIQRTDIAK